MARLAAIMKNNKRKDKATRYWKHRRELREAAVNFKLSDEKRMEARKKLQKLPRDTSPCRALALDGKLPGVTKASW